MANRDPLMAIIRLLTAPQEVEVKYKKGLKGGLLHINMAGTDSLVNVGACTSISITF